MVFKIKIDGLLFSAILVFSFLFHTAPSFAQQKDVPRIEKRAYDKMLQHLLSHTVKEISVSEAANASDIIFLDARAAKEFEVSHIKNAQYIGYDDFEMSRVVDVPKDAKIVVYCSVGYRSEKIAERLMEAGFEDVSNLYGGIFEWKNQDQKVVNEVGTTEKVHAFDRIWGFWLKEGEKVY
ncbi:MAG: rhodanese-like domain-containing protein [Bacteroidota bacterium]